jgi:hypothetical protein
MFKLFLNTKPKHDDIDMKSGENSEESNHAHAFECAQKEE